MKEIQLPSPSEDVVGTHLMECLRTYIVRCISDTYSEANRDNPHAISANKVTDLVIGEMGWLTSHRNIHSIANQDSAKELFEMMVQVQKRRYRWDFISNTLIYLKFRLGTEGWKQVMRDVCNALCTYDQVQVKSVAMSDINRQLTTPDLKLLEANHWLVVVVLYAIYPSTDILLRELEAELNAQTTTRARTGLVSGNR